MMAIVMRLKKARFCAGEESAASVPRRGMYESLQETPAAGA
jgi:hypothetical protein